MIKGFLNIFILFTFALTSLSGLAVELHVESSEHDNVSHSLDSEVDVHCSDCEDDCSEKEGCCSGLCVCPVPLIFKSKSHVLSSNIFEGRKLSWHYYQEYSSPPIYPALKPPLHS